MLITMVFSVLDRLQSFLPQMAQANEKLKRAMEQCPPGHFDIESVEENEKIIEMASPEWLPYKYATRRLSSKPSFYV